MPYRDGLRQMWIRDRFTNPYDIGASNATDSIKYQLLSQIIIKYTDNGKEREFNSYEYASMRDVYKRQPICWSRRL